jgi:hypothetical protein
MSVSASPVFRKKGEVELDAMTAGLQDCTAEELLEHFSDIENYAEEALAPYQEFGVGTNTYYFTPGGFLYRRDPGTDEIGGFFCGYLTDEVWHYRTDNS